MKSPRCLVKYVIGLSLALIAVSNCFNVLSNSSDSISFPAEDASRIEAAKRVQDKVSLASLAGANRERSILESSRVRAPNSRAGLATTASAVFLSPFAPIITATKSHMLQPGDTQADPGDTVTYTIVISNTGSSDATGVNFTDTIDPNTTLVAGSVIASPIAVDDNYHTIGNVNISVPVGQGVIANDSNPNGSGTLTVTKVNSTNVPGGGSATTGTTNGSVTMSSDGSFSYTPNVAFRGPTDSFTYTLGNGTGKTDTATVTIAVNGLIWFVNVAAAPGGDGRLSTPFNCLVGPGCFDPAAADIANDNIFVYTGAYVGGLTLLSGQKLIGQGAGDTLLNITGLTAPSGTNMLPSTGGTPPVIAAAGANITLGSGNTIRGVSLDGTAAAAVDLTGTGFGTITIAETSLGGVGQALNLNNGTLSGPVASTASFTSISSLSSATTGITLTSVAGNMSSGSTSVTTPAGAAISVSTSSAALNFGSTTVNQSGGAGVGLTNNTGSVAFAALNITNTTTNQAGLVGTDNSGTISTTSGAINTGSGAGVNITRSSGTTPLNITLTSVTSTGGTAPGINLLRTSGSFTVAGDGGASNNGSGGTISNKTGSSETTGTPGVRLNNVSNVRLKYMNITGNNYSGIYGTTFINGVQLDRCNITNNGDQTVSNPDEVGVALHELTGTAIGGSNPTSITNTTISNNWEFELQIANTTGTLTDLQLSGNAISSNGATGAHGDLVSFRGSGSANMKLTVTSGAFTGAAPNTADGIFADTSGGSTTVEVSGATFTNNNAAIDLANSATGSMTFDIHDNPTITGNRATGINVFTNGNAPFTRTMSGKIRNNVIGTLGTAGSGSSLGNGISIQNEGSIATTVLISGNTIQEVSQSPGINSNIGISIATGGQATNLTVLNNTVRNIGSRGIVIQDNAGASPFPTVCADIAGNVFSGVTGQAGNGQLIRVRRLSGTFNVKQKTPTVAADPLELDDANGFNDPTKISISGTINFNSGGCVQPLSVGGDDVLASSVIEGDAIPKSHTDQDGVLQIAEWEVLSDKQVPTLLQAELNWLLQAAIERWRVAGISPEDLERLQAVTFEISDLPERQLAAATSSKITIDANAAGFGWYFDQIPSNDNEFELPVIDRQLEAIESSHAFGQVDLLTVVMREFGYVYLQGRDRVPKRLIPLMQDALPTAVRRLPLLRNSDRLTSRVGLSVDGQNGKLASNTISQPGSGFVSPIPAVFNPSADKMPGSYGRIARRMSYAASARRVAAFSPAAFSGETVTLNIGTIPPGESVTIMFQVTIDNPLPAGVCTVTNQGHVTGANFSQVDTNIDVITMVAPVAISACPANIMTSTDPGLCTAVVTYTTPTASGCPATTVTCNPPSGFAFPKGTTTVTCTATNGNPPDSTCTFTVTVNDNQPPTITCPSAITQSTDPNQCSAVVTYSNATATDNCAGVGTPVCTPASGSTFAKGTTTVNCTVSDASGNPASCSFTVTVNDTQAPTITCPSEVEKSTDPNECTAVVTYPNATATDNCSDFGTPVCTPASGSTFAIGTTTVNCTVSDASGNSASCSFTVTVKDTQAPTIGPCPSNISVTSGGGCQVVNYTPPTATDNCGSATVICSPPSGTCFAPGTTTVTCTASDTSLVSPDSTCSFTVTVVPCTITCPSNITTGNDPGQCGAIVTFAPTTSGGGCGTVTCAPASGSFFPVGTTPVTCSTQAGPSCNFSVTVRDTEAPTMGPCPPNVSVTTSNACQVVTYPNPTATDNCGGANVSCSPPSGFCFPPGTTTVTCTASDTSPNSPDTSCSFTVTVVPCAITCPPNITRQNDAGLCGASVIFAPTSSAGCGMVTCSPSSGSFFPVGTTTVTCTTSAGPGCSFTVTVTDTQGPNITTTTQPIELWPPNHKYETVTISQLVASATDNCSGNVIGNVVIASVSSDEPENGSGDGNTVDDIVIAGNCKSVQLRAERDGGSNGRVYTIVLKVTDAAGNVGTASRTVTVPHSQGGGPAILGPGPGYSETGTCP